MPNLSLIQSDHINTVEGLISNWGKMLHVSERLSPIFFFEGEVPEKEGVANLTLQFGKLKESPDGVLVPGPLLVAGDWV